MDEHQHTAEHAGETVTVTCSPKCPPWLITQVTRAAKAEAMMRITADAKTARHA